MLDKNYRIFNGTAYSENIDEKCMKVLDKLFNNKSRVRLFLGDPNTGKDWCERFDVLGYIGRSTGKYKIPLLIAKSNSMGGPGILDENILKIVDTKTKEVLYQNDKYKTPTFEIVEGDSGKYQLKRTDKNNEVYFTGTKIQCEKEKAFFVGERMSV